MSMWTNTCSLDVIFQVASLGAASSRPRPIATIWTGLSCPSNRCTSASPSATRTPAGSVIAMSGGGVPRCRVNVNTTRWMYRLMNTSSVWPGARLSGGRATLFSSRATISSYVRSISSVLLTGYDRTKLWRRAMSSQKRM